MKDLEKTIGVNPEAFCKEVEIFGDRTTLKGRASPVELLGVKRFKKWKEGRPLTDEQFLYLEALVNIVAEKYPVMEHLRNAIHLNFDILDPKDPSTPFDMEIVKRLFFYERRPMNMLIVI